jgi:hypothetical protein
MGHLGCLVAATALAGCASGQQPSPAFSRGTPAVASLSPVAESPTPRPLPNDVPTPPGSYVLAGDALYGISALDITFTVPREGWISWGPGVVTTEPEVRDRVAIGFVNVANLYADACHWRTAGVLNPAVGPSVAELVDGLAALRRFTASAPTEVSLAGFAGSYVELTIDADLDFSTCDAGEVHSWVAAQGGSRYHQGPGQIEQFWILDVRGTRLVIDRSLFPQASRANRDDLARIIESIQVKVR